ncbi:MAG: hypothetical protein IT495_14070 [Gammaproteobacteria bacterium]|nr:hypothetical protein [Gammaproteobacteria bacterium]
MILAYDRLGRLPSRLEPEGASTWGYDTAAQGVGKLASASGHAGDVHVYGYDALGRPASQRHTLAGSAYALAIGYDGAGRMATLTYPASPHYPGGLVARYAYNGYGYLDKLSNDATALVYWQASERTAAGALTGATFGNGVQNGTTLNSNLVPLTSAG